MTIEESGSGPGRSSALSILLIAFVGFGLYINALDAPFFYDDLFSIVEDPSIRSFSTLLEARPGSNADGRPLVSLTLALNHALGGLEVFGYRLFNTAVHVAVAIALFVLLLETLGARGPALSCALVWVAHPLNTDALGMVVTRNEALCALFFLTTLWAAARGFRARRSGPWFVLAVFSSFLAAASKETAITLPVAVLLYDRTFATKTLRAALRQHAGLYVGLLSMAAFLVLLSINAERGANVGFDMNVPWFGYLLAQVEIVGRYIGLAFWPDPLVVDYGDWLVWKGARAPWMAALILAGLAGLAAHGFARRNGADILGWTFFAVLAPTSLIPVSNEIAGEHRMYLPLVAVVVATVLSLRRWLGRAPAALPVCFVILASGALGAQTVRRNADYSDPVKLWGQALEEFPRNTRASVFLGDELFRAGFHEAALRVYREGLDVKPQHSMLLARSAQMLRLLGREDEAQELDQRRARGGTGPRFDALAAANDRIQAGETEAGLTLLREAIARWPDFERGRMRLAQVLATTGDPDLRAPEEALRLAEDLCARMSPPNPNYLALLATAQAASGRADEARRTLQRAYELALAYGQPELARSILARLEN